MKGVRKMDIFEKAKELGQAIIDSEEFKTLKAAEDAQENDAAAIELLRGYSELRTSLAKEVNEEQVSEQRMTEIRDEMERAYQNMMENEKIAAYVDAQNVFKAIVDQMNSILSFYITGETPGGCSGSCHSCDGCH